MSNSPIARIVGPCIMSESKLPEMETVPNIQELQQPTWKEKLMGYREYWTTKDGWIGDYVCPP